MWGGNTEGQEGHCVGPAGGIMRDKMADKKVIVWAKVRGILRDNNENNMVIVWANEGAY